MALHHNHVRVKKSKTQLSSTHLNKNNLINLNQSDEVYIKSKREFTTSVNGAISTLKK